MINRNSFITFIFLFTINNLIKKSHILKQFSMTKLSTFLPPPLGYRKEIPLYYPKTEAEIKADGYERYNPNVIRSCRNFYEGSYGEKLLEVVRKATPDQLMECIVELGCGSGYLIGNLAEEYQATACIGLDYSYQMLKMAAQVFKNQRQESEITIQGFQNGMDDMSIRARNLSNLTYALSDACVTPFQDGVVDFCFSCFLWDRVGNPEKLLLEKMRILKPEGKILIISPFNYLSANGWNAWHPMDKVVSLCERLGLQLEHHEAFELEEMLDVRSNKVVWQVEALVLSKS